MATDAEPAPVEVGELFEKYQILKLLGQGGYASVYHARREFIDRDVAIKISNRSITREVFRRFQAEARLTNKLKHPNIVEVFDADVADSGHLYIVMELLLGQTFWDAQKQHGKLTVVEALSLCAQVAEGVEQAHRAGAIHRDLKPLNLFIVEGNHVKVLDFGIAKLADGDASSTQRDVIHGTMKYMSPEQLQGLALTPRSDIFALGTILFELLIGEHPCLIGVEQPTALQLGWAIATKLPPMLDELDATIPRYVARAVQRALSKQPEQRFASMAEFAALLRECCERYQREVGAQAREPRALWRPAAGSGIVRTASVVASGVPSQEHIATAVVAVVSPQSLRPTVPVGVLSAPSNVEQPDASVHTDGPMAGALESRAAPSQGGPREVAATPAPVSKGIAVAGFPSVSVGSEQTLPRRFSLRKVLIAGAGVGFLVGAGLMLARTTTRSPPLATSHDRLGALTASTESRTPLAAALPEPAPSSVMAAPSAPEPRAPIEATPISAESSAPSLAARRPASPNRTRPRPSSSDKKMEERLNWFQEDSQSATKPSSKRSP